MIFPSDVGVIDLGCHFSPHEVGISKKGCKWCSHSRGRTVAVL